MPTALSKMLSKAPEGAQFSYCALGGGILAGASAFVILLGLAVGSIGDSNVNVSVNPITIVGGVGFAGALTLIILGASGEC